MSRNQAYLDHIQARVRSKNPPYFSLLKKNYTCLEYHPEDYQHRETSKQHQECFMEDKQGKESQLRRSGVRAGKKAQGYSVSDWLTKISSSSSCASSNLGAEG